MRRPEGSAQHASAEESGEPTNGLHTAASPACPATVCHLVPRHGNFSRSRFCRRSQRSCCVQGSTAPPSRGDTEGPAAGEGEGEGNPGTQRRRTLRGRLAGHGALPVTPVRQRTPVCHSYPPREGPGTELSSVSAGDQARREALTEEYAMTVLRLSWAIPEVIRGKLKCMERT